MRMIKDYMRNDTLRYELNALTAQTFGFDFESWYANGYYTGDYLPYSLEEDGKIIANVSVNRMQFLQNGAVKNYIQLGTVMTDREHRGRGLARKLMECVIKEYEGTCEGIYLFSNLNALGFYKKLGFQEKKQYRYQLNKNAGLQIRKRFSENSAGGAFRLLSPADKNAKETYKSSVKNSACYGAFDQVNKYGLQMFYTSGLDHVYYSSALECFLVMEKAMEKNAWIIEIQSTISTRPVSIEQVLGVVCQDREDAAVRLGFTPRKEDRHLFDCISYDGGDDYRLFCRGELSESIDKEKLYFPALSHA